MNRCLLFLAALIFVTATSCKNDDDVRVAPPRDYGEQYAADIDSIENYLKNHYMTVDEHFNVSVHPLPSDGSETSIWDQTEYPLQYKIVKNDARKPNDVTVNGRVDDPVDYKLYYILFNEGGGISPSVVDSVFVSYKGWRMVDNNEFERRIDPLWLPAGGLVSGFRQMLPMMKTAENFQGNPDGTVSFFNYGACVVFLPSGLGYFNNAPFTIGQYQPIAFTIQLKGLRYRDHDNDGILSKDEMYNDITDPYLQDTDGDGIPDFLDVDDDGDGVTTRIEITDEDGNIIPFELIPDCNGNTTDPDRLKKHLDPSCH